MPQNELLKTILSDYVNEKLNEIGDDAAVSAFCAYAAEWLQKNKPIGLGHSFGNGLSIRFADGRELVFFDAADEVPITAPAFSITGNVGGAVRQANVSATDTSHSISVT